MPPQSSYRIGRMVAAPWTGLPRTRVRTSPAVVVVVVIAARRSAASSRE